VVFTLLARIEMKSFFDGVLLISWRDKATKGSSFHTLEILNPIKKLVMKSRISC
jgi:hypothetical protein